MFQFVVGIILGIIITLVFTMILTVFHEEQEKRDRLK